MFSLAGRKFLVTGASGGIGRAITTLFCKYGATVCISGTKVGVLNDIAKGNNNIHVLPCDLSNNQDVSSLINSAVEIMSGIDGLICNAGITYDKLVLRMNDESWQKVIDINLNSTFKLNRDACKYMLKNKWGRIINISSVIAMTGNAGQSNYAASKAAVIAMSKSIAREVADRNITVNCIAPGFIDTTMTQNLTTEQKEAILKNIPLKKMGTVEDIASGALFLASEQSKYITGTILHINGGLFMN